jgi:hypothetical protein
MKPANRENCFHILVLLSAIMDEHAALYLDLDLYPIFTSKLANQKLSKRVGNLISIPIMRFCSITLKTNTTLVTLIEPPKFQNPQHPKPTSLNTLIIREPDCQHRAQTQRIGGEARRMRTNVERCLGIGGHACNKMRSCLKS